MKTSGLPSYTAATTRSDPWGIVAPYVPAASYAALCLTSRTLHAHFAPRLWNDPLRMVQLLRLDRDEELSWYLRRFIGGSVKVARESTRGLVLVLDFRDFATFTADFLSSVVEEALEDTIRRLPTMFPRLRCLLLDGHPAFDPGSLTRAAAAVRTARQQNPELPPYKPLLLSIAGSNTELPTSYFVSEYMRNLVYLDISQVPGSLRTPATTGAFGSRTLPCLRVLKARGRELGDAGVNALCTAFGRQLWSLDVSCNNITDAGLAIIVTCCCPNLSLWSDTRYDSEGKVNILQSAETQEARPLLTIKESDLSGSFCHPERHFADSPAYEQSGNVVQRPNGLATLLRDGPDDLVRFIAGGAGEDVAPDMVEEVMASTQCLGLGLTHLAVRENRITRVGVERMIQMCRGNLEYFECDMALMRTHLNLFSPYNHRQSHMYGLLGSSWLFRPVMSSSLRSLYLHHSIVTQVPTITLSGSKESLLADAWLAEMMLLPRAELVWPGDGFIPDMNPRLTSLTLTSLPRRSAGPLVEKLKHFLRLLYEQEQAIDSTRRALSMESSSPRTSVMLKGMRRLRLEFEQYSDQTTFEESPDDGKGMVVDMDADTDVDMDQPPPEFSFFHTWGPETTPSQPEEGQITANHPDPRAPGITHPIAPNIANPESIGQETLNLSFDHNGAFTMSRMVPSSTTEVSVWVGPKCFFHGTGNDGEHAHPPAITEYVRNVKNRTSLRTGVGPATPPQVQAGAPPGVCLFQAAWDAILLAGLEFSSAAAIHSSDHNGMQDPALGLPRMKMPTSRDVSNMVDVVFELKRFRAAEMAEGRHWTGALEVVHRRSDDAARDNGFWRGRNFH
ncbi:hypothetical protein MCOR27_000164 [Pyricularia oryzae]|uniref:RNI-like protein n=2 Tax=Pyricularia TaxID=48558 RepID=A0ABQ8NEP6_PYRGI|nr:hypothetical protein MCOR01_006571 [Pyricularia oryzae]KAI6295834.1 hypothetical protein MCOR33_007378 [Pyricularia grisea]KAH9435927.1 hypothetical protein MCOR02_004837 [Pyricularia oryzae]KAI6263141.1 hypothetical protein MCOR19_000628 [Pyricularia oryzae]KAI6284994.1 hypothetical protein MCOR26_001692 [Pyricularia oryzae]